MEILPILITGIVGAGCGAFAMWIAMRPETSQCSTEGCRNHGILLPFDGKPPERGQIKPMDSRGPVCCECCDD